jgi:hypothetical protein
MSSVVNHVLRTEKLAGQDVCAGVLCQEGKNVPTAQVYKQNLKENGMTEALRRLEMIWGCEWAESSFCMNMGKLME